MLPIEIKKTRYIQALFSFGIIPLTLLLEEYEQDGNFEECKIIYDVICHVNKYSQVIENEILPTKYSPEIIAIVKSSFNKFGFKGETALNNTPFYIEEIKKLVRK